jgi:protein-S-isoprenylcysteine O-methyltransferase Ste14
MRSVEPTFLGWFVALSCYYPFWNKIEGGYFAYNRDNYYWDHWLANEPTWLVIWGSAILLLLLIYMWASVAFGLRFSNLTNRGILTNGPYRFSKHPAYISKNLAWWLIAVPFISQTGAADAIQHSLLLLALNAMYFLRARTEEDHLSKDPTYLAYATRMNEKSLLHGLNRVFPFLRYNPSKYSPQ